MRRLRFGALAAASVLLLAACGGEDVPDPGEIVETVEEGLAGAIPPVATVDNNFAPSNFSAPGGQEITVNVVNNGQNPHSFTIDALDVDTGVLESGGTAEVTFAMPEETVDYYCTIHGAEVMSGTIDPA
jgi:plastocyanin